MNAQKIARVFGWLFIATFVTAIAARVLFMGGLGGTWSAVDFTAAAISDTRIQLGALFEFGLIVTNIGTAVVLYPIMKRYSEIGAVGYVTARIVECTFILVGLISLLSVVTLSQAGGAGTQAAGESLLATYEWAFLFGPGLVAGLGNGLLLGYLMYRSNLVPRPMAMLGLIGGTLLTVGFVAVLFDVIETGSAGQAAATAFEFVWELSLGIYAAVKGFKPSALTALGTRAQGTEPGTAVA